MNNVVLMGRISSDPEIRVGQNNSQVCRFNFAVPRRFKREGDPDADFFSCIAFGKLAETFDKLNIQKGVKLLLDGEIRNNNYTDKNGVKRYENQIVVASFEFCESKGQTHNSGIPKETKKVVDDGFLTIDEVDDALPWN